jgi:hypothetical protein
MGLAKDRTRAFATRLKTFVLVPQKQPRKERLRAEPFDKAQDRLVEAPIVHLSTSSR